jgi:serine/threonine protein kinase
MGVSVSAERFCPECDQEMAAMICPACKTSTIPASILRGEDDTLPPGTIIGNYRVDRPIGEGAFGKVYLGYQRDLDKRVAIKTLRKQFLSNKDFVTRFYREAKSASKLEDSRIVNVFDFGVDETHRLPYLVMEYLSGRTLNAHIRDKGRLPEKEVCYLLGEVAGGLIEAHRRGLIHRDLKPDNIWLRPLADGRVQVKILDFGIAKALSDDKSQTLTQTGMLMGTPHFMSPEQISDTPNVDERSDLYALGCILFFCLTGEYPFDAEGIMGIIAQQQMAARPALPKTLIDGAPPSPGLGELQEALFARSKEERPASARVVATLCRELGQGHSPDVERALAEAKREPRVRADPTSPGLPVPPKSAELPSD